MSRKRKIATREIYKWKSRLNLGGHKQTIFDEASTPAHNWTAIRLFLILSILHKWHTQQVDFVLAYPQANASRPTYMELSKGINIPDTFTSSRDWRNSDSRHSKLMTAYSSEAQSYSLCTPMTE
mmetsp:Transcript_27049/g.38337  ORF Transcript_27049/g.38337 Transcript_27049/m.38337 type:complete len:124 (-) Transcript_27049:598-969(-)